MALHSSTAFFDALKQIHIPLPKLSPNWREKPPKVSVVRVGDKFLVNVLNDGGGGGRVASSRIPIPIKAAEHLFKKLEAPTIKGTRRRVALASNVAV